MTDRFARTRLLVGDAGIAKLAGATVAIFGLGGVGSYAVEAIARAGVGHIVVVDHDVVEPSNLNRQLLALDATLGRAKVEVAAERIHGINPAARVEALNVFISGDNVVDILDRPLGYAVEAIDTVSSKTQLIIALRSKGVSFVSCMGAAAKTTPMGVTVADISRTTHCPLARRIRQQLRRDGVQDGVRCVYVADGPGGQGIAEPGRGEDAPDGGVWAAGRRSMGSISYVPGLVGLTAAGVIVNDILASA